MPQPSSNSFQATLERALPALSGLLAGRRLPFLAFLALLVLVAWLAARLSWQFAAPAAPANTGVAAVAGGAGGSTSARGDLVARITSAHLFGQASAPAPAVAAENAPKTTLDLTLLGVAAGGANFPSQAIIANGSNRNQHTYAIGASLPGGAVVHGIFADRVVIAHDGRLESLSLPQPGTSIIATDMHFGNGQGVNMPSLQYNPGHSQPIVSSRFRHRIEQHPESLMQYLKVRPYEDHGKVEGYRVYPGNHAALFKKAGLQPGDLVTRINGVPLNNGAHTMEAMAQLRHARGTVQLEVKRHGKPIHITLHLPGG